MNLSLGRLPSGAAALFVAAAALAAWATPAHSQLSVSPLLLHVAMEGQGVSRTISVSNSGGAPISVTFRPGDFEQAERGEHSFAALGTFPSSCGQRMRVSPERASVLPGETFSVRVELDAGAGVCWSAVFVETVGNLADGTPVRQSVAVKVHGYPSDASVEGEVTRLVVTGAAESRTLSLTFRNTGEAPVRPQGELEIRTLEGEVVAKSAIDAFSALPGRERTVQVPLKAGLAAGEYLAVPILDFGGKYLVGGQAMFTVTGSGAEPSARRPTGGGTDPR